MVASAASRPAASSSGSGPTAASVGPSTWAVSSIEPTPVPSTPDQLDHAGMAGGVEQVRLPASRAASSAFPPTLAITRRPVASVVIEVALSHRSTLTCF